MFHTDSERALYNLRTCPDCKGLGDKVPLAQALLIARAVENGTDVEAEWLRRRYTPTRIHLPITDGRVCAGDYLDFSYVPGEGAELDDKPIRM